MAGINPSIAAAPATEPCEHKAEIHSRHSGDRGGRVVNARALAAIRRTASKIAEKLARGLAQVVSALSPRLWDWVVSIRRITEHTTARQASIRRSCIPFDTPRKCSGESSST